MEGLINCSYVARPFATIGARSSRYIVAVFARGNSELSTSLAAETKFVNIQYPTQSAHPRHRSTAELRVVVIETSRTESLREEPSP